MSRNGLFVAGIVGGVALQTVSKSKNSFIEIQEANAQRPAGATQGDRQLEII
jgi:hypothetical protein